MVMSDQSLDYINIQSPQTHPQLGSAHQAPSMQLHYKLEYAGGSSAAGTLL